MFVILRAKMNKKGYNARHLLEGILSLLLFVHFIFIGQSVFTLLHFQLYKGNLEIEKYALFKKGSSHKSAQQLPDPVNPEPLPENSGTNDSKEEVDDDRSNWTFNQIFYQFVTFNCNNKSWSSGVTLFFKNRTTVPLFILHHTWKSFLS